ncbi:hypothetical protein CH50_16125 [Paenibacillus darwinianus]|nr:hypothetical protein CH50_16125 [Paenibacillus darwinianus]
MGREARLQHLKAERLLKAATLSEARGFFHFFDNNKRRNRNVILVSLRIDIHRERNDLYLVLIQYLLRQVGSAVGLRKAEKTNTDLFI